MKKLALFIAFLALIALPSYAEETGIYLTKEDGTKTTQFSGGEPIYLEGSSEVGILLMHGFSASPHEVQELAYYLNKKANYTVYAPLLAGHGANPDDFGKYSWQEWLF